MVSFSIETVDVLRVHADVLGLKFSETPRGAEWAVLKRFAEKAITVDLSKLVPWNHVSVESKGCLGASDVIFVAVPPLRQLSYGDIRTWAFKTLEALKSSPVRTLAVTIHGPGFGLDMREAFLSELGGFIDAIKERRCPLTLAEIVVAEPDASKAERLAGYLREVLPTGAVDLPNQIARNTKEQNDLASFGIGSENKKSVFVAMPFAKEFRNTFDYGIEKPVQEAGYLCERIDDAQFAGDIRARIQEDISKASLVIADLSGNNPNVYLEVGYAWGKGKTVLFVARTGETPTFDVRGHKTLSYSSDDIKALEDAIRTFLTSFKESAPPA